MKPGTEFYLLCVIDEHGFISTKHGKQQLGDTTGYEGDCILFEDLNKADIRPVDPVSRLNSSTITYHRALRALNVGEIIQQGDLYLDEDGKYHPSELINEEVKEWHNPPSWWRPEF